MPRFVSLEHLTHVQRCDRVERTRFCVSSIKRCIRVEFISPRVSFVPSIFIPSHSALVPLGTRLLTFAHSFDLSLSFSLARSLAAVCLSQSAAEAQRRAMADELQRARLSLREEEALIERKRAALNADIERAQRAQSELIKVRTCIHSLAESLTHTQESGSIMQIDKINGKISVSCQ
jgi:hypothetical protein